MSKKKTQTGKTGRKARHYSTGDYLRLFLVYWVITFMLVVLGLFSVGDLLPGWAHLLIYLSSLVVAGIATFVHVSPGKEGNVDKEAIDKIADELK